MAQDESPLLVKRLCGEIQLFDLCDLDQCNHKDGRFCTHSDLLTRFERIADEDDVVQQNRPVVVCEEADDDEYGAEFVSMEEDDYSNDGEEDDTWEEE
jgi:hypothetical protein